MVKSKSTTRTPQCQQNNEVTVYDTEVFYLKVTNLRLAIRTPILPLILVISAFKHYRILKTDFLNLLFGTAGEKQLNKQTHRQQKGPHKFLLGDFKN